jgi:putative oxidoreductase
MAEGKFSRWIKRSYILRKMPPEFGSGQAIRRGTQRHLCCGAQKRRRQRRVTVNHAAADSSNKGKAMWDLLYAIGRVCLPILFFPSGVNKLLNISGTVSALAAKGFPSPTAIAYLVAAVELVAAIMVVIGFKTRWAAFALFVFTGLTILFFHNYWTMSGTARLQNQSDALKNLAIMAGMLLLMAKGAGRYSVDERIG